MELNIIKQIKSLRQMLRHKPKVIVEKPVEVKLSSPQPVITGRPALTVNIDGRELTLKEIATEYGLEIKTVQARYKVGNRGRLLVRPSQKTYKHTPKHDLTNIS